MAEEKQFSIQRIYTKDISFETPNSPKVFTEAWNPTVELNLGSRVEPIDPKNYEVILTITVTVKSGDTTAYLAEVSQAGIFALENFSDQEKAPVIGSYCPNVLFPYAREVVSDLVVKGGFPQLLLAPVNFDALYAQHVQQKQAQANQAPNTDTIN